MSSDDVIGRDVAEADFARWAKAMRLERKLDPANLDDNDKKGLATLKSTLLDAIQDRILVVDGDGLFELHCEVKGDPVTLKFKKPMGADLMAIDQAKSGEDVKKTQKFLASVTGKNAPLFAAMELADFQICDAIATLFLAR